MIWDAGYGGGIDKHPSVETVYRYPRIHAESILATSTSNPIPIGSPISFQAVKANNTGLASSFEVIMLGIHSSEGEEAESACKNGLHVNIHDDEMWVPGEALSSVSITAEVDQMETAQIPCVASFAIKNTENGALSNKIDVPLIAMPQSHSVTCGYSQWSDWTDDCPCCEDGDDGSMGSLYTSRLKRDLTDTTEYFRESRKSTKRTDATLRAASLELASIAERISTGSIAEKDACADLFKQIDTNSDNSISLDEVSYGLSRMSSLMQSEPSSGGNAVARVRDSEADPSGHQDVPYSQVCKRTAEYLYSYGGGGSCSSPVDEYKSCRECRGSGLDFVLQPVVNVNVVC